MTDSATEDTAELIPGNSLAGSAALIVMLTVGQRVVGMVRSLVVASWLEPNELGQWDLAFTFLGIAAPLTVLGLPGSFGRYVQRYARQGQLKMLLRRTLSASALLSGGAMLLVAAGRPWLARFIFGDARQAALVLLLSGVLGTVILFNFLSSLLSALRMYRVFAGQQFLCSVLFAAFAAGLLFAWQPTVAAIVLAYGAACLVTAIASAIWLWRLWQRLPEETEVSSQWSLWSRLLPLSMWVWFADLAINTLVSVDRYMLIHYSGWSTQEVFDAIGQYHCARIVPVVLTTAAFMIATMLTPHLARSWEAGRRDEVCDHLHFVLKIVCLAVTVASLAALLPAEWLHAWGWLTKHTTAVALMPGAMACGIWLGMVSISQNYLLCAERARWGCLAILAGIVCNLLLSAALVPHFGLRGTLLATGTANFLVLTLALLVSQRLGMRSSRATWFVLALPATFAFGSGAAAVATLATLYCAATTDWLFDRREKAIVIDQLQRYLALAAERLPLPVSWTGDISASVET